MEVSYGPPASPDSMDKPKLTYVQLIKEVIETSETGQLSLKEIYEAVVLRYPYYATVQPSWKNVIRHCLSITPTFQNLPRQNHLRGKGGLWFVDPSKPDVYSRKRPKRSEPSRSSSSSSSSASLPTMLLPPYGAVPIVLVEMTSQPEYDPPADDGTGGTSGFSSSAAEFESQYWAGAAGPPSDWSTSPQMPLEAMPTSAPLQPFAQSHAAPSQRVSYQPLAFPSHISPSAGPTSAVGEHFYNYNPHPPPPPPSPSIAMQMSIPEEDGSRPQQYGASLPAYELAHDRQTHLPSTSAPPTYHQPMHAHSLDQWPAESSSSTSAPPAPAYAWGFPTAATSSTPAAVRHSQALSTSTHLLRGPSRNDFHPSSRPLAVRRTSISSVSRSTPYAYQGPPSRSFSRTPSTSTRSSPRSLLATLSAPSPALSNQSLALHLSPVPQQAPSQHASPLASPSALGSPSIFAQPSSTPAQGCFGDLHGYDGAPPPSSLGLSVDGYAAPRASHRPSQQYASSGPPNAPREYPAAKPAPYLAPSNLSSSSSPSLSLVVQNLEHQTDGWDDTKHPRSRFGNLANPPLPALYMPATSTGAVPAHVLVRGPPPLPYAPLSGLALPAWSS